MISYEALNNTNISKRHELLSVYKCSCGERIVKGSFAVFGDDNYLCPCDV